MLDLPVLSRETDDSPRSASAGESSLEKRGRKYFLTTWKRYYKDALASVLRLLKRSNPRILSLIIRRLSRRSSIRRLDEIRFAPIERSARCETSTATSMVPILSASKTLDMGVTSTVNPGILDIARTAALTYRPTLVPIPIG